LRREQLQHEFACDTLQFGVAGESERLHDTDEILPSKLACPRDRVAIVAGKVDRFEIAAHGEHLDHPGVHRRLGNEPVRFVGAHTFTDPTFGPKTQIGRPRERGHQLQVGMVGDGDSDPCRWSVSQQIQGAAAPMSR